MSKYHDKNEIIVLQFQTKKGTVEVFKSIKTGEFYSRFRYRSKILMVSESFKTKHSALKNLARVFVIATDTTIEALKTLS